MIQDRTLKNNLVRLGRFVRVMEELYIITD